MAALSQNFELVHRKLWKSFVIFKLEHMIHTHSVNHNGALFQIETLSAFYLSFKKNSVSKFEFNAFIYCIHFVNELTNGSLFELQVAASIESPIDSVSIRHTLH